MPRTWTLSNCTCTCHFYTSLKSFAPITDENIEQSLTMSHFRTLSVNSLVHWFRINIYTILKYVITSSCSLTLAYFSSSALSFHSLSAENLHCTYFWLYSYLHIHYTPNISHTVAFCNISLPNTYLQLWNISTQRTRKYNLPVLKINRSSNHPKCAAFCWARTAATSSSDSNSSSSSSSSSSF